MSYTLTSSSSKLALPSSTSSKSFFSAKLLLFGPGEPSAVRISGTTTLEFSLPLVFMVGSSWKMPNSQLLLASGARIILQPSTELNYINARNWQNLAANEDELIEISLIFPLYYHFIAQSSLRANWGSLRKCSVDTNFRMQK
jgi:hypothetical protein